MTGEEFRLRLHSGQRSYGIHLSHWGGAHAAHQNLGLHIDFAFIDSEHTPISRAEIATMCRFYAAGGITPVVRVPFPDAHLAAQAMDAGAWGVVVPYVESSREIELIGAITRYRPLKGERLHQAASGEFELNETTREYLRQYNRHQSLLIGIESVPAIERLDSLCAAPGVDAVFIGPHDLSISMGIPEQYQHPEFVEAVTGIIRAARAAGLGAGMHLKPENAPEPILRQYLSAGLNFILFSHDFAIMRNSANASLDAIRRMTGDELDSEPNASPEGAVEI